MSDPTECPSCGADFQGEPIPEASRHWYGGATHFSRCTGISDGDSIHTWVCPDCGHHWPRAERRTGFRTGPATAQPERTSDG